MIWETELCRQELRRMKADKNKYNQRWGRLVSKKRQERGGGGWKEAENYRKRDVSREEVKGRNRETGNDSARRGNRESSRGRMRQGMLEVEVE